MTYSYSNHLAKERLLASLTREQRQTMAEHGWFEVISNKGHRWRIVTDRSYTGNVYRRYGWRYCGHVESTLCVPWYDHYLAQALTLRTDEKAFRRAAHCLWYMRPGAALGTLYVAWLIFVLVLTITGKL